MDRRAFLESTQEARKLLETGIAGLAAVKHTPEQLAALKAALEDMRAAKSAADMVEPDVRFHLALLAAANNDLLAPFGIVIEQALGNLFDYTTRHNPKPEYVIPLHEDVVNAVAGRDPDAARQAVTRLLNDTDNIIAAESKAPAKKLKRQLVP
jgi:DNA-binding FadR family transcriptional regulator